jgi:hypothetical protein
MSRDLPLMKAGLPASPTGEEEVVLGLSPDHRPVEEDSPVEEKAALEASPEGVAQEADVLAAAKIIASQIKRAVWPF